jgi:hypothetical protein
MCRSLHCDSVQFSLMSYPEVSKGGWVQGNAASCTEVSTQSALCRAKHMADARVPQRNKPDYRADQAAHQF